MLTFLPNIRPFLLLKSKFKILTAALSDTVLSRSFTKRLAMEIEIFPKNRLFIFRQPASAAADMEEESYLMFFRFDPELHLKAGDEKPKSTSSSLFQFKRPCNESISCLLSRCQNKIGTKLDPTYGKRLGKEIKTLRKSFQMKLAEDKNIQSVAQENVKPMVCLPVALINTEGNEYSPDTSLCEVLETSGTILRIGKVDYSLTLDTARINKIKLDIDAIVGCPLTISIDAVNPQWNELRIFWYVKENQKNQPLFKWSRLQADYNTTEESYNIADHSLLHVGHHFIPSRQMIGKSLCAVADFGVGTLPAFCPSNRTSVIREKSDDYIWEKRQEQCRDWLNGKRYRFLSYNLLANLYLDLDLAQNDLWFPFCPKEFQKYQYRYPLLLNEIPGYKADIMCLQEVEVRLYRRYLNPLLTQNGWLSEMTCKAQKADAEGCAIAWKQDRFRLLSRHEITVSDLTLTSSFPENQDLLSYCERAWASIKEKGSSTVERRLVAQYFLTRPTILQVVALQPTDSPNCILLVANTHLHSKPWHEHIRLVQIALCTRYLESLTEQYKEKYPDCKVNLAFCGDFNFQPTTGPFAFVSEGKIDSSHESWRFGDKSETEKIEGLSLKTKSKFFNASGTPQYTNYCLYCLNDGNFEVYSEEKATDRQGFGGCLDYIWLNKDGFEVEKVIPLPDHTLVTKHIALPSKIAPSDHLPVISEVIMK